MYYWTPITSVPKLRAICLNTMWWSRSYDWKLQRPEDPADQFKWLSRQLSDATKTGDDVLIVGHVPPGYSYFSDRFFSSKSQWYEDYEMQFLTLVAVHRNVVVGQLFGHFHVDDFRLQHLRSLKINVHADQDKNGIHERNTRIREMTQAATSANGINEVTTTGKGTVANNIPRGGLDRATDIGPPVDRWDELPIFRKLLSSNITGRSQTYQSKEIDLKQFISGHARDGKHWKHFKAINADILGKYMPERNENDHSTSNSDKERPQDAGIISSVSDVYWDTSESMGSPVIGAALLAPSVGTTHGNNPGFRLVDLVTVNNIVEKKHSNENFPCHEDEASMRDNENNNGENPTIESPKREQMSSLPDETFGWVTVSKFIQGLRAVSEGANKKKDVTLSARKVVTPDVSRSIGNSSSYSRSEHANNIVAEKRRRHKKRYQSSEAQRFLEKHRSGNIVREEHLHHSCKNDHGSNPCGVSGNIESKENKLKETFTEFLKCCRSFFSSNKYNEDSPIQTETTQKRPRASSMMKTSLMASSRGNCQPLEQLTRSKSFLLDYTQFIAYLHSPIAMNLGTYSPVIPPPFVEEYRFRQLYAEPDLTVDSIQSTLTKIQNDVELFSKFWTYHDASGGLPPAFLLKCYQSVSSGSAMQACIKRATSEAFNSKKQTENHEIPDVGSTNKEFSARRYESNVDHQDHERNVTREENSVDLKFIVTA